MNDRDPDWEREREPTPRIACIVIATERRRAQVWERVVPSVLANDIDPVVVGDWVESNVVGERTKYLNVAPLTRTTIDALVKRDVGTLATDADVLVYLSDDHILAPGFGDALRASLAKPWDVIVPNRRTRSADRWPTDPDNFELWFPLYNGEPHAAPNYPNYTPEWHATVNAGYCPGHAGIFRRHVITAKPWSAHAHTRVWDVEVSREQQARGARFVWRPRAELSIIDIEPTN